MANSTFEKDRKAFEKHISKTTPYGKFGSGDLSDGKYTYADDASKSRDYNKNKSPDVFEAKKIKDKKNKKTLRKKTKIRQGRGIGI